MLKDIKHTIKQSAVYGLSRISAKLISFILIPLYSLNFSIQDYGVIVRVETLWQIFWSIFLFGLESGIIRWYTLIENEKDKKSFLFTTVLFVLSLNVFLIILIFFTSPLLANYLLDSSSYSNLIIIASLIAVAETLTFIFFLVYRIQEKAVSYTVYSILISVINLSLQIFFIYYTSIKIEGIFLAKAISPMIIALFMFPYISKHIRLSIDIKNLKELIKYSFPIMLATLLSTMLNQSNRYILGMLTDSKEVGIYGLGSNITGFITVLIISPYTLAFSVISWKKIRDENAKRFFTKSVTYLFLVVTFSSLVISLFMPQLIKLFTYNMDYWLAKDIIPWIIYYTPFYAIQTISIFSYYYTKNTKYILYFYLVTVLLNIVLNFALIPVLNTIGSAIANFASFVFLSVLFYKYSYKEYYFKYEWYKLITCLVVAILLTIPFFIININNLYFQIILKLIAVMLYPFILYLFKFYEDIEVSRIKEIYFKYKLKISTRS